MFSFSNRISLIVFCLISIWITIFRANNLFEKEISWDVFGYYLPLQATFIEGDYMLENRAWVDELNAEHQVTDTVYQVSSNDEGEPMYFFFFGMSYLYAIFFAIGHFIAGWLGYAQNGLSPPYQLALVYGCILYTIIGLYYFRKIMLHFFDDRLASILLLLIVFGTNYSHHMTLKNLETVNVLFMFIAIILWNTIKWYESFELKRVIYIGVSICLMTLAKPSEVLIVFLPVLWGVTNLSELKERIKLLWSYRKQFFIAMIPCLILAFPQVAYWYAKTGKIFFDTYRNPGVGLDLFTPHFFDSLFSYRKGWLVYTPLMLFSLIGFYFLWRNNRKYFFSTLFSFVISYYIIASWTEYWYGAGFSNRPVIAMYVLLAIPLGYFLKSLQSANVVVKYFGIVLILFFVFLNQFQWWQMRNYILDPYRTTGAYYWKTFLKTNVTDEDKKLLLVNRSFTGVHSMVDPETYHTVKKIKYDKIELQENGIFGEYAMTKKIPYHELTSKDHCWVRFSFDYQLSDSSEVMLAVMMDRKNGNYANSYYNLIGMDSSLLHFDTLYLTPEIRSVNDDFMHFFWNRTGSEFSIKNFNLEILEKK